MPVKEIEIKCQGATTLALESIEEFQGNLKKRNKKDIDKIIKSIEKYGFSFPFFIWNGSGHNYCLDGHGRIQALCAMRNLGFSLPLFPVVYIDAEDEEEAKNKLLRLNSQYGQMTSASVLEFTEGIDIEWDDLELPGGKLVISSGGAETEGDDDAPEEAPSETALGDIYELSTGETTHRLICGDSTKTETIEKLMNGQRADLWLTDPPYNVDYTGKTKKALKIQNDKKTDDSFLLFLKDAFIAAVAFIKEGASFYIWHADSEGLNFRLACKESGLTVKQCLIWNKNCMVMGRQDYQWKHEPCLYGWKDGSSHSWFSDRKQTTVLNFDRPQRSEEHPTMKPVELFSYQIQNSTKKGDIVLDTFGGSGTTIIACEKLGRNGYVVELGENFCDVIVLRFIKWAKENGLKPVVTKNGKSFSVKRFLEKSTSYEDDNTELSVK